MADRFVLNTPRFKGEFVLDINDPALSAIEWRWVKKIAGYLPATASQGMADADPDLYIALAVIALVRAGRIDRADVYQTADELAELPFDGSALHVVELEEAEPSPPAEAPATSPPTESTGASSKSTSDRPAPSLLPTGVPD